jgi:hypothetical protein
MFSNYPRQPLKRARRPQRQRLRERRLAPRRSVNWRRWQQVLPRRVVVVRTISVQASARPVLHFEQSPVELATCPALASACLFYPSRVFPPLGVAPTFSAGDGDISATGGGSTCCAASTRINALSAAGGGLVARPATTVLCELGAACSR